MKQEKLAAKKTRKRLSNRTILIIVGAVLLILIGLLIWFWEPLYNFFSDTERLKTIIKNAGPWGPVLYILLQFAQIVLAPIPAPVIGFVGGFAFGTWLGTLYSVVALVLGYSLIFILARRFGRPFAQRFVSKKILDKFDYLTQNDGVPIFFLIYLIPAFPDDLITYVAGLSKIPIKKLLFIAILGRLPSIIVVSYGGANAANDNWKLSVIVSGIAALIFLGAIWQRKRIERLVRKLSRQNKAQL